MSEGPAARRRAGRGRGAGMAVRALIPGLVMLGAPPSAADRSASGHAGHAPAPGRIHWSIDAGGFAGLTGPAGYGIAAAAQVFPGRWPGEVLGPRFGLGLRYRGFEGLSRGLVAAGLAYQAGATRPHLVMELHGELGLDHGTRRPVLGGGVRTQLGLWGPVTLAVHADGYLLLDGLRPRLAIVPAVTLGLAR